MLVRRCDICRKDIKKAYYRVKVDVDMVDDAEMYINEFYNNYIKYSAVDPGRAIDLCRDCFTKRDNFLRTNIEF